MSEPVAPAPVFLVTQTFPSGGVGARTVAAADFNGDGKLDLAVASACTDANCVNGSVNVLLGNGDGTYQVAVSYPSGSYWTQSVVAGDFNHDGKMDLALVSQNCTANNCTSGSVSILLGNGNGTFQAAVEYPTGGGALSTSSLAVGDLNGDGNLDIVVANEQANDVGVLLGKGDGTFKPVVTYPSGGIDANSVVVGDFNGDGKLDLAVANNCADISCATNGPVGVLLGNGDGTFKPAVTYNSGGRLPTSLAVGDFNGDGKLDLVVVTSCVDPECAGYNSSWGVLLGNGDGTFQAAVVSHSPALINAVSLCVGDFNGEGILDLAITTEGGNDSAGGTVVVLLGKGDGTFQVAGIYDSGGPFAVSAAVGDFNGDGKLDLAVSNDDSQMVLLLGMGNGRFVAPVTYALDGLGVSDVVIADFNGDGNADLAVAQRCTDSTCTQGLVSLLLGNGDGSFRPPVDYAPGGDYVNSLVAGDFNRDGKLDLAVANGCTDRDCDKGSVGVLLGNGDGTFRPRVTYPSREFPAVLALGDFTGDGKLDLAAANSSYEGSTAQGSVSIFQSNGDGTFKSPITYPTGDHGFASMAVGDFNGDGKLDLVLTNDNCVSDELRHTEDCPLGTVTILLSRGDGSFQPPLHYSSGGYGPTYVAVGDFNADGKLDLAVTNCPSGVIYPPSGPHYGPDVVSVLLGNGDGTFQTPLEFDTGIYLAGLTLAAGDLNGDGKLDLLLFNLVMLGNGDGTFQAPLVYEGSAINVFSTMGDLNGDGKPEMVLAGVVNITPLLNVTPGFRHATSTALTSSVNPAGLNQPVTFTATVTPGFGHPITGSVTFHDGTLALATMPISTGQVQFSTSSLNDGTHALIANYDGDANFVPSSSKALAQVVTSAVDFVVTTSSSSATVSAGSGASYTLSLRTLNGFSNPVSLACSGLPTGANCSFSPASPVMPTASGTSETVTISTTGATMARTYQNAFPGTSSSRSDATRKLLPIYVMWLPLAAIAFAGMRLRPQRQRGLSQRGLSTTLMCILVIALTVLLANCGGSTSSSGGGGTNPTTPAGSYSVTVTATSGSLTHTTVLTLTVQ